MEKVDITFQQFRENWEKTVEKRPKEYRKGQYLMLLLSKSWPEEYTRISSVHYYDEHNIDCYYVDKIIPNILKHLEEVWLKIMN